jgi:hypothetical protein
MPTSTLSLAFRAVVHQSSDTSQMPAPDRREDEPMKVSSKQRNKLTGTSNPDLECHGVHSNYTCST